MIYSASICNGRRGRFFFELPERDSTKMGVAVKTSLDSKPWQCSGTISLQTHSVMGLNTIRLNSTLKFTFTPTSEGLFGPLGGCSTHVGAVIIELHLYFAQYFELVIVYIFSFPVKIPLWQSWKHCKVNNDIFSILQHQLHVLFPPLGVLVAILNGYTVWITWELLSLLRDAQGLRGKSGVWCKSNARHH